MAADAGLTFEPELSSAAAMARSPARRRASAVGLLAAAPVLLALLYCLADPHMFMDGDTAWHLASGRWILAHGAAPHADPFSYTFAGRSWTDLEWLSEALIALAFNACGWPGVMTLMALAVAGAVAVMAAELRRWLTPIAFLAVFALCLPLIAKHVLARPHLLALPLLALWMRELVMARRGERAPRLWFAALMALWANLHGSFLLGLGLAVAFACEAVMEAPGQRLGVLRRWAPFLALSSLATMATPYGVGGLLHAISLMNMSSLSAIDEWKPVSFAGVTPLEVALLATLAVCLTKGVRLSWVRAVILVGLIYLALAHIRHELILAVVAPLILAEPIGRALAPSGDSAEQPTPAPAPWTKAVLATAAIALIALRLSQPEHVQDGQMTPVSALNNVPAEIAAQPVFNDYGFGGWLILNGVKPAIDGRNDMYGDQAFYDWKNAEQDRSPGAVSQAIDRRGVVWAILTPDSPLAGVLEHTRGWVRLYGDSWAVVDVRPDALAAAERRGLER